MNDTRKAGALIIADLALFNQSALLLENEIEPKIIEELNERVRVWVDENEWFDSHRLGIDDDEIRVIPQSWITQNDEGEYDYPAWFSFGYRNEESDSYELADLCGVGQSEMGFWLEVNHGELVGTKTKWNSITNKTPDDVIKQLEDGGFHYEGKGLYFLPVHIDILQLSSAWENDDYEVVFDPIIKALDQLRKSVVHFDGFFNFVRKAASKNNI